MVHARDIAEVAAIELLRRAQSAGDADTQTINLVGPDFITAAKASAVWSEVLGRPYVMEPIRPALNRIWRLLCRNEWRIKRA